jgi:hypothetical protein
MRLAKLHTTLSALCFLSVSWRGGFIFELAPGWYLHNHQLCTAPGFKFSHTPSGLLPRSPFGLTFTSMLSAIQLIGH